MNPPLKRNLKSKVKTIWIILDLSDIPIHKEILYKQLFWLGCSWSTAPALSWIVQFVPGSFLWNDKTLWHHCKGRCHYSCCQRKGIEEDIPRREDVALVQSESSCVDNNQPASLREEWNLESLKTSCWETYRWKLISGSLGVCKRRGSSSLKTSRPTNDRSVKKSESLKSSSQPILKGKMNHKNGCKDWYS